MDWGALQPKFLIDLRMTACTGSGEEGRWGYTL